MRPEAVVWRLEAALGGTVVGRAGLVTVAGRSGHSRLQLSGSGSVLAAAGSPAPGPGLHQHHQELGVQPQPPLVPGHRTQHQHHHQQQPGARAGWKQPQFNAFSSQWCLVPGGSEVRTLRWEYGPKTNYYRDQAKQCDILKTAEKYGNIGASIILFLYSNHKENISSDWVMCRL